MIFVEECHAERTQNAGVLRVNLRCLLEEALRLLRLVALERHHPLEIKNVGMIGGKLSGFAHKFLSLIEFVFLEGLQSFVRRLFRLGSKQRTCVTGGSATRIALQNDIIFGLYCKWNGYLFLRSTIADCVRGRHIIAKLFQDEDSPPSGWSSARRDCPGGRV